MFEIAEEAIKLVRSIIELAKNGASSAEIRKALNKPNGVAQGLLDAVAARREKLDDYIERG
jgi:hypothetical protein